MSELISVPIVGYIEERKIFYYKPDGKVIQHKGRRQNEKENHSKTQDSNEEKSSRQETDRKTSNT